MPDLRLSRFGLGACLACFLPLPASAQDVLSPAYVLPSGTQYLFDVKAVAALGSGVVVLTGPDPAVHLFRRDEYRTWGREGRGPAELLSPADVAWTVDAVHVLDMQGHKIVSYDERGTFLQSRTLGSSWAGRLVIAGGDTVIGSFAPMTDRVAVVRLGPDPDTLLSYERRGDDVRLTAPGAPPLTVKVPFTPQVVWCLLGDGTLAWYDPASARIRLQGRSGQALRGFTVPWRGEPVTADDREWWIENGIPGAFQGRAVFEPLRAVARDQVDFPATHAPVLGMLPDGDSGLWLRLTTPANGETWRLVTLDGVVRRALRLPAGRRLLAADRERIYALATDHDGVETVEAYAIPARRS